MFGIQNRQMQTAIEERSLPYRIQECVKVIFRNKGIHELFFANPDSDLFSGITKKLKSPKWKKRIYCVRIQRRSIKLKYKLAEGQLETS
jgi:hypothetical protein